MIKKVISISLCLVLLTQITGCQALKERFVVEESVQETQPIFGEMQKETEEQEEVIQQDDFRVSTDYNVNTFMEEVGVITTNYVGDIEPETKEDGTVIETKPEDNPERSFEFKTLVENMNLQNFGSFSDTASEELESISESEAEVKASMEAAEESKAAEQREKERAKAEAKGETIEETVEETEPVTIPVTEAEEEAGIKRAKDSFNRLLGNGIDEMTTLEWIDNLKDFGFVPSRLAITTTYTEDGYTIEQAESIAPVTPGEVVHVGVVLNQKYLEALKLNAANERVSHMGYLVSFTLQDNPSVKLTVGEVNRFDRIEGKLECMYTSAEFSATDENDRVRFGKNKTTWAELLETYKEELSYDRLDSGLNTCDILSTDGEITSLKFTNYKSQDVIDYLNNFTKITYSGEDEVVLNKIEDIGQVYWNNRSLDVDEIIEIKDLVVALDKLSLFGFTPVSYRRTSTGTWNEYSADDFAQVKKVYKKLLEGERDELTITMYLVQGNTDNAESGDVEIDLEEELIEENMQNDTIQTTTDDGNLQVVRGSSDNIIGAEYTVLIDKGQIQKTQLSINRAGVYTDVYKINSTRVPEFDSMTYTKSDGDAGVQYTNNKITLQGAGSDVLATLTEGLDVVEGNTKSIRSDKYRLEIATEETNTEDLKSMTFTRYWR